MGPAFMSVASIDMATSEADVAAISAGNGFSITGEDTFFAILRGGQLDLSSDASSICCSIIARHSDLAIVVTFVLLSKESVAIRTAT